MKDKKRMHVTVYGTVQGVFFRSYTQMEAQKRKLAGWVRNRPDGSVEAVVEGEPGAVDSMVEWFREGPPTAKVAKVEAVEERPMGETGVFNIRFH
jgi:acylphosphatase